MKDSLNIVIAGASGYIGLELVKILSKHKKVKILYLCGNKSAGKSIHIYNKTLKKNLPKITRINNVKWGKVDVLFTSLPNGEAQQISNITPEHVKIIDLAADFRLNNAALYKKWYGVNHNSKQLIKKSIYALTEFSRNDLNKHRIIACPGCYPTSVQIPLIPLIINKAINTKNIIIDSKSGYSGAGKNIKKKFKFKNLFNSVSAYGVGSHRHTAEIDQELSKYGKKKINVFFTPHLIPMFRGILSTIYIETKKGFSARKIYLLLKKFHKRNFLLKLLSLTLILVQVMS